MSRVQNMAALAFILPPPPPHLPKKKKKKKKIVWIWILCQNSLTRELKIRFVGLVLYKLFTHDKFHL